MTALQKLLDSYRQTSQTEREKGTYFEELIRTYFRFEATYADLYSDVWLYSDWAKEQGLDGRDTGIDLVAKTQGTNEYHAIQCKCYAEDYRVKKSDIDSFFTASGKKPFTNRIIVTTTNNWSEHAENALQGQQPPVNKIDLNDLENSQIDWSKYQPAQAPVLKEKKKLRDHQVNALNSVATGLATAERGKLIMACGTGKTFTSLKIAEKLAGKNKRVLFLVPSLSLLSQTLTEWTQESQTPLHSFAVCSDSDVGKKRNKDDDAVNTFAHELRYPATTEPKRLAEEMTKRHDSEHMSVVFSTYHSIDVISKAQKEFNLADFDLIICDEAHRTTGATFESESESNFVKVHDANFIKAAKRLYMTATPRIYGDSAKVKEEQGGVKLCSMDDESLYGKELFVINFSEAVSRGLLCDYKVIVLTVDAQHISDRMQSLLSDENNQLKVDDAAKIVGCWKALSKQSLKDTSADNDDFASDAAPMRRAVAFCQVIEPPSSKTTSGSKTATTHKVSSKNIASMFQAVVEAYQEQEPEHNSLVCEAAHVDGSMNASQKEAKLTWLKAETESNTCRILSNVRCLSEGVDVPALDAVLFLTPRNSQVDVVQSVGRVMRNAPNKKLGYVILPVVIPSGMSPDEALNDNKTYKVVWEVLQALRSHDDRFDAMINKLDLIGKTNGKMEVISITDKIQPKQDKGNNKKDTGKGQYGIGEKPKNYDVEGQLTNQAGLEFEVGEIERALYAKVVKKCGNRNHWGDWANDIAKIANTHITRITSIVQNPANSKEQKAFAEFANELRDDLNDSITDGEVIEMLAQHLITKPVFDALFSTYNFTDHNPMSKAMQGVLDVLQEHNLNKEADTLEKFYASVRMRAEGIDNAQGKQKIVVELYDKFFRNAFPKMTERLGIVYTPVEVVDFIIHSVNDILKQEFNQTLGSEGVHIIDPFTGTGTFITRLLQSGLIPVEKLKAKYKSEIHANEIVLLAYYIAAINIEAVYHDIMGMDIYEPFNGICLTDTFQMYEKEDLVSDILVDNSARRKRQKSLDIRVIMGNPPYSVGQGDANANNANVPYPSLDARIRDTYGARSEAINKNSLYDSYIRSIRWASDRIGSAGVIGFVTNAGFIEARTADGLRKCLVDEFSSLYVFHLRGLRGQKTAGERAKKEGGQIFGMGSSAAIAISLLVKNPEAKARGQIYFHDIGDYLSREEKLDKIVNYACIAGISSSNGWEAIEPDGHGDWLNQRDDSFSDFIVMGDKDGSSVNPLFANFSRGVATSRDAWCYNASKCSLTLNMTRMISFYNCEVARFNAAHKGLEKKARESKLDDFINTDPLQISWNRSLKQELVKERIFTFKQDCLTPSLYRPFTKQWLYFNRQLNDMVYQMPRLFPDTSIKNRVICVSGKGDKVGFSSLISDAVPCLHMVDIDGSQCFPLYLYEKSSRDDQIDFDGELQTTDMFAPQTSQTIEASESEYQRKDGISDAGLAHFTAAYPNEKISKEGVFYYVYGLLHSSDYRERYADNLSKELPRIPCVKTAKDFWHFSQAGRDLAELHLNYETVACYPVTLDTGKQKLAELDDKDFYVTKMKFAKKGEKHTVIYNHQITIRDIPEAAFDYVVNGKAALDWVMERQAVTTHKDSGIVNDANDWAIETMGNAKYPLELFQRVITVSLETMKIVNALPKLDI
jgi:predicted helicase